VPQPSQPTLADLRVELDRIDAAMHELLIERGRVIDQLIDIKTRQGGGSAFRPAREASMMRAIVERHRGRLPLDTVEGIWRVIISTFTFIQAPYAGTDGDIAIFAVSRVLGTTLGSHLILEVGGHQTNIVRLMRGCLTKALHCGCSLYCRIEAMRRPNHSSLACHID
jgi:chorismate mutase